MDTNAYYAYDSLKMFPIPLDTPNPSPLRNVRLITKRSSAVSLRFTPVGFPLHPALHGGLRASLFNICENITNSPHLTNAIRLITT